MQSPRPKVVVRRFGQGENVAEFSPVQDRILQSYSWQLQVGDVNGSFSLQLFPENGAGEAVFDKIKILDIVMIYEQAAGQAADDEKPRPPVFTGVVRQKKYTAQANDSGGTRRLSLTGTSIAGLITQFYVNLDTKACAITGQLAANANIRNDLTTKFVDTPSSCKTVQATVKTIWEYFDMVSKERGTPRIKEILDEFAFPGVFEIDGKYEIHYPLGCVFDGESTRDFFSIIDDIIPEPLYEKTACTDLDAGLMKVVIREAPFDAGDWQGLKIHKIDKRRIKAFDITQDDTEVYTAFYSYLSGYPIQEDKALLLSTVTKEGVAADLRDDSEKYGTYGYRPLMVHFLGYGKKDGEDDSSTDAKLAELNDRLKKFYGRLDEMLKGTATLAMTYGQDGEEAIMPGERIGFLGGEFYVEGVTHSWSYGAGGSVGIAFSRGGKYEGGEFSPLENISDIFKVVEAKSVQQ